jgi:hypothetical protein
MIPDSRDATLGSVVVLRLDWLYPEPDTLPSGTITPSLDAVSNCTK